MTRARLWRILILVMGMLTTPAAGAQPAGPAVAGVRLPQTIAPLGETLSLVGCGVRQRLWADLYVVSLYRADAAAGSWAVGDPRVGQALRLDIVYHGDVPDELPGEWRERLSARLDPELLRAVEAFYAGIARGDVVVVAYRPGLGTLVTLNGRTIRRLPGAQLMQAMMDIWVGPDPLSTELRRRLLRGHCAG